MRCKATIGFAGVAVSMAAGEVRDVQEGVAAPLLACGYLVEADETAAKKKSTKKPVK